MGVNVTSRNLNADGLIKIDTANSLRGFNGANSSMSLPTMERNLASDTKSRREVGEEWMRLGRMRMGGGKEWLRYVLLVSAVDNCVGEIRAEQERDEVGRTDKG